MASDILVVDDEADIRDLVSGILEDEGHRCRLARDSDEALRAIEERRPQLVILALARNSTACATSSGVPIRPAGTAALRRSLTPGWSYIDCDKGVRIMPGCTQLLRIPCGPHSTASWRDSMATPALATLYAPLNGVA